MSSRPTRHARSRAPRSLALLWLVLAAVGCAETTANVAAKPEPVDDPLQRISARELYERGQQLALHGDPLRAEQYLSAAMARGYPSQRVLPVLLRACLASSRLGAALQYAEPQLKLHPDDYHLRYLVAALKLGFGRAAEARTELTRVVRDAPDYAEAHYLLGVVLRDHFGDAQAAAEQFALHQRLNANGLHGAEVAAWLREQAAAAPGTPPAPAPGPQPVSAAAAPTPDQPPNPTTPSAEANP